VTVGHLGLHDLRRDHLRGGQYGDQIGVTIQILRIGLQIATLGLNDVIIVIEAQIGLKTLDARSLSMAIVAATTLALRGTSIKETARGGRDGLMV
jgi:hypothetical protein